MNDNRILFMIIDGELKYLTNSNMDHKEWYKSLDLDIEEYDNTTRGFIINNKIIFFKEFFKYDNETIKLAEIYYPKIRQQFNNPNLEVYCGILPGKPGEPWEPILRIDDKDSVGRFDKDTYIEREKVDTKGQINDELDPLIELKNDYSKNETWKIAKIGAIVMLIVDIILKVILYSTNSLKLSNSLDTLLLLIQILLLIISIYGYSKKIKNTNIISLIASIAIILSFNIFDIIVGFIYFVFNIDQNIFTKLLNKNKKVNQ